ncbi:MAG: NosD domain-containing protein [Eubacterium sp.]|jgi:hypothetical protein
MGTANREFSISKKLTRFCSSKRYKAALLAVLGAAACLFMSGCQYGSEAPGAASVLAEKTWYVSSDASSDDLMDGSEDHPFREIQDAVDAASGGDTICVGSGNYQPFEVGSRLSGSEEGQTIICAAEGAVPVILPDDSATGDAADSTAISLSDISHVTVKGFEINGGGAGIVFRSSEAVPDDAGTGLSFEGICIEDCYIHDIKGVHGIAFYSANAYAPVTDLVIKNCRICRCELGDSEALVLNGNIDGFEICGNIVSSCDNIGIDMAGFEGTALLPESSGENIYKYDRPINGIVHGNTVSDISSYGNSAYWDGSSYSLAADGIYSDGGSYIKIYDNEVRNCDIGIEVATEHDISENELFYVTDVEVYENNISDCSGFAGLCIGGYDSDRGFTVNSDFHDNVLDGNAIQIFIQRSRGCKIRDNVLKNSSETIVFSDAFPPSEMDNEISGNEISGND